MEDPYPILVEVVRLLRQELQGRDTEITHLRTQVDELREALAREQMEIRGTEYGIC